MASGSDDRDAGDRFVFGCCSCEESECCVDGCVAVEIDDMRDVRPCSHRVLLRPQYDVVVRDAAASSISSDHDLLFNPGIQIK